MFTQTLIPKDESLLLSVPRELVGHLVRVTIDDLESKKGESHERSIQEILTHFSAVRIDTRGFSFNREEANQR